MIASHILWRLLAVLPLVLGGCALFDDLGRAKPSNTGLIATPPTYYSTAKARYLGGRYKDNLDRIVERIVRNGKTSSLQFANNISSVGGIGFFTHSATKTADERYLEVVLATPENFETKGSHSDKVNRVFSLFGLDLLAVLSGDNDIYQDSELTGYGLNLAWRNVIAEPTGSRVMLERAIIYLPKEKARGFVRNQISQPELLAEATIFAVEEDGPLNLVSYRPPQVRPELRPAIREDNIGPADLATRPPAPAAAPAVALEAAASAEVLPGKDLPAKIAPPRPPGSMLQKTTPLPVKSLAAEPSVPVAAAREPIQPPPATSLAMKQAAAAKGGGASGRTNRSTAETKDSSDGGEKSSPKPAAIASERTERIAPSPKVTVEAPKPAALDIASQGTAAAPVELKPFLPPVAPVEAMPAQARPTVAKTPAQDLPNSDAPAVAIPAVSPPPVVDKAPVKPAPARVASLTNKPMETAPVKATVARPAPRPLEGFIIQLAFNDKERAQRWAEGMEKKGYAVSLTEAGTEGALRVRLGNFVARDDAEKQLRAIKQEGLNGIILNLPQAFRPEARSSIP